MTIDACPLRASRNPLMIAVAGSLDPLGRASPRTTKRVFLPLKNCPRILLFKLTSEPRVKAVDDFYGSLVDHFAERTTGNCASEVTDSDSDFAVDSLFDNQELDGSELLIAKDDHLVLAHL